MRFPVSRIAAAFALAAAFLAPSITMAQTDAQKAAMVSMVNTYYKAGATGDATTFASLVTPDYKFTTIKGNVLNSSQVLAKAGVAKGKALAGGASGAMGHAKVVSAAMDAGVLTITVDVVGSMNIQAGGEGGTMTVQRTAVHQLTAVKGADGKWRFQSDKVVKQMTT